MKFYDKYYVGLKIDNEYEMEKDPEATAEYLGFATPIEDNAAYKKRKETVDNWANGRSSYSAPANKQEPKTFDNVPVSGFEIGKSVSRWTNSNKVYRVTDPRGFDLEITASNLARLIAECVIDKGNIQGRLLWARDGNQNYLVREEGEDWGRHLQMQVAPYVHEVGDYIKMISKNEDGNIYMYAGRYYGHVIKMEENRERVRVNNAFFHYTYKYTKEYFDEGLDKTPYHVYVRWKPEHNRQYFYYHGGTVLRRAVFKVGDYAKEEVPKDPVSVANGWTEGIQKYRSLTKLQLDKSPVEKVDVKAIFEEYERARNEQRKGG